MQRTIISLISTAFVMMWLSSGCLAIFEDPIHDEITSEDPMALSPYTVEPTEAMPELLAEAMEAFQQTAEAAAKQVRDGVLPEEETEKMYIYMSSILDDIIEFIHNPNNAYNFLDVQGFDKIITRNLGITYSPLRGRLLVLTKILFDIAPTTTKTVIPWGILDKLMEIFEQDDDLTMKSQAMEVMSVWLPNNVRAQERVMKQKGLEPFYKQIPKLDAPVISKILKLFNNIIAEHMAVRNKKMQRNEADYMTVTVYQRIGLIERMSTPRVCNGLLNILVDVWPFATEEEDALPPVLDLIQNIKPHCLKVYTGRSKAVSLLNQILSFLREPIHQEYFERQHLNVTDISKSLTDFMENIKVIPRYEL